MSIETSPMMVAMSAAVRSNVPVLLWGNPGVGKTAKIASHGEAWGYHVETIIGSIREPSDFMGLPVVDDDNEVFYSKLDWAQRLCDADKGLLFLDELTTSSPSTQRAMLRITQEREVGSVTLPDSVAIIAAANPPEIAVDGFELPAPIANRFLHLDWVFDHAEWSQGFLEGFDNLEAPKLKDILGKVTDVRRANVRATINAFLKSRPDLLAPEPPTDPSQAGGAWPSPRSWTNAGAVLSEVDGGNADVVRLILLGCVGEGAMREFVAWEATMDLIDPDEAMADPSKIDWANERPDRLFVLMSAVSVLVSHRGDSQNWKLGVNLLIECANGGKPDVATPAAIKLFNNVPDGARIPKAAQGAFMDILQRTGRLAVAA